MDDIKVSDIRRDGMDEADNKIECVYFRSKPEYAVYRTEKRVCVHFADDDGEEKRQRRDLSRLTPLRGQINTLIDGWRTAGDNPSERIDPPSRAYRFFSSIWRWMCGSKRRESDDKKRAERYDRRVADAIVTALHNDVDTALALLAAVKNDIISERISIARGSYLWLTFLVSLFLILFVWGFPRVFPAASVGSAQQIWIGLAGGTVGTFYSIAIGLRGRHLVIDLQNRENVADALLRVLIGTLSGGLVICLLLTGLVSLQAVDLIGADPKKDILTFVIGFIAGFFERLVPNMLAQTNLGTKVGEEPPGGGISPAADPLLPKGAQKGDADTTTGDNQQGGTDGAAQPDPQRQRPRDGRPPRD